MSEKPPAYESSLDSDAYVEDKKSNAYIQDKKPREKREITLLHSDLTGSPSSANGPESSLLFPPTTTLIRIWSGMAVDGIEYVTSQGTSQLLGSRTGSPSDYIVPVNTHITAVSVRCGSWIDAIQMTFSNGTSTPWCGGSGGSQVSWSGVIVGLVAQSRGNIFSRFAVITAQNWNEYAQFYQDTQQNGIAAEREQQQQQQHQEGSSSGSTRPPQQQDIGRGKYSWDTGRWTRNRGIGVRWNHERHRVEIYQGSNDAKKY